MRKDLKTTYLGNYMEPTASEVVSALEAAGIEYWSKNEPPGLPLGEFGYRIFVDKDRFDEARLIADRILTEAVRRSVDDTDLEDRPAHIEQEGHQENQV
jgi:hypothetical protein